MEDYSLTKYLIKLKSKNISCEWWGQQWCQNIGKYADYANRLERGRTYIRKQAVESLELKDRYIAARVKGSYFPYYDVVVEVDPLREDKVSEVLEQIKDISLITNGYVSNDYYNLFTVKEGLFPDTNEIRFSCTCPDCASMCKHVAAVLYAFGSILDKDPLALFKLRGVEVETYFDKKLYETANKMFQSISSFSSDERTISEDDISNVFGLDIDFTYEFGNRLLYENEVSKSVIEDEVKVIEIDSPRPVKKESKKRDSAPPKSKQPKISKFDGYVIRQYDLNGIFIKQYYSYDEIKKEIDVSIVNIQRTCRGIRNSSGGYQWKKVSAEEPITNIEPIVEVPAVSVRPINCYDDNGMLIAEYKSIAEAVRISGVNSKSIRDAAKGKQKHAGGYVWKYKDEVE